jgi:hypothetical protein
MEKKREKNQKVMRVSEGARRFSYWMRLSQSKPGIEGAAAAVSARDLRCVRAPACGGEQAGEGHQKIQPPFLVSFLIRKIN